MISVASGRQQQAFKLIELLLIIAVLCILAAVLLPRLNVSRRPTLVPCMSNLRQVSIGIILARADHGDQYMWQVSAGQGGTLEYVSTGTMFPQVRAHSSYWRDPKIFWCYSEEHRKAGVNVASVEDRNLSYFLNVDSETNRPTYSILSGHRHLAVDGRAVAPGLATLSTNNNVGWTRELHKTLRYPSGVLAFGDGHVEMVRSNLNTATLQQGVERFRVLVP
jgi:hypothetical protein